MSDAEYGLIMAQVFYVMITVVVFGIASATFFDEPKGSPERKLCARIALLCAFWPLMLIALVAKYSWILMRDLVKEAL